MKITFGIATKIDSIKRREFLYKAIESVLNQTSNNWELIISDDNSIIKPDYSKYKNNKKIKIFFQKKSLGIFGNFNFCLKKSTTEFFLPLGDDDLLEENFVEEILKFYNNNLDKKLELIAFNYKYINTNGKIYYKSNIKEIFFKKGQNFLNYSINELYGNYEKKMFFCSVISTKILKKIGGYPDYGMPTDIYLIYFFSLKFNFGFCNKNLIRIRHHFGNASGIKKIDKLRKQLIKLNNVIYKDFFSLLDSNNKNLFLKHKKEILLDHITLLLDFKENGRIPGIRKYFKIGFSYRKLLVLFFGIIFGKNIQIFFNYFIGFIKKIKYYVNSLFYK